MRAKFTLLAAATLACGSPQHRPVAATPPVPPQIQYCSATRTSLVGIRCVRELTAEERRRRERTWVVTREDNGVVHVFQQNGRGHHLASNDGEVEYRYLYHAGSLSERQSYDRFGNLRRRYVYSENRTRVESLDEWGRRVIDPESLAVTELRTHDAQGFLSELRFLGLDGKPVKSAVGAYVTRQELDERGLPRKICHFDSNGRPMTSRWGIHCEQLTYDDFGIVTKTAFLDVHGKPVANLRGVYRVEAKTDLYGNVVETVLYGSDGSIVPAETQTNFCSRMTWQFVDGTRTSGDCFDERGQAAIYRTGSAFWRDRLDERGRVVETRQFDALGELLAPNAARVLYGYDDRGFVTEKRFFMANGDPGQRRGPAVIKFEPNERGRCVLETYFDGSGRPSQNKGCAQRKFVWDDYRQLSQSICLNADGQPSKDDDGATVRRFRYQANGLIAETSTWDAEGRLVDSRTYSREIYEYDVQGAEKRRVYFKADGALVPLARYRIIRLRPPYVEAGFTYGSRERAFARLNEARQLLVEQHDFEQVAIAFSDSDVATMLPGDIGYLDLNLVYASVRAALEPLKLLEISPVVEIPAGLFIYQRTE